MDNVLTNHHDYLVQGNDTDPKKAIILLHGRGSNPEDIMGILRDIELPDEYLVIAPRAQGNT